MHVFSGVVDKDFSVELPPKSISEYLNFKIFLEFSGLLAIACFACLHNIEAKALFLNKYLFIGN